MQPTGLGGFHVQVCEYTAKFLYAYVGCFFIIKNEKYIGILKQRKVITTDYLSHKRKRNEGEEKHIIVENNHASIIDKAIFDRVQAENSRRKAMAHTSGRYSNRYVWSGKIKCALCGSTFKRGIGNNAPQNYQIIWKCSEAVRYGKEKIKANGQKVGCNCKAVHEEFLKENFLAVLNTVIENKDAIVKELETSVQQAIDSCPNKSAEIEAVGSGMAKITAKKSKVINLCVDGLISREEFETANNQYNKQLVVLNQELSALELDNKLAENLQQKLNNIETTIEALVRLKEFSDSVCGEVLSKVVVDGRDKIAFYLTNGKTENPEFFQITPLIAQS